MGATSPARAERVVREFSEAVQPEAPAVEVLRQAAESLEAAVPADYWCGVLLDPSTLLDTGGLYTASFPAEVMPRLFEIEYVEQSNADNLRALTRRKEPVTLLSRTTGGDLDGDVYYRDILRPLGMADEMRVLLRQGPHTWGLLVWCRGGSTGFAERDVELAAALGGPAASALRGSLVLSGADDGDLPDAPGLLLLDEGQSVLAVTPTAQQWLDELQEVHAVGRKLPNAVLALAAQASAATVDRPVRSRALTRTGRWAALHGWLMDGERIAVSIGPAGVTELVALVLDAYGLTTREREVTQQVLRGGGTNQIASALSLSPYTVQDHLRAIFRKVGVGSARELMSELFGRHYQPHLGPDRPEPPLSTDGRLYESASGS
ncbi:MAG: LuxR C-terminal-related transcriptional regulator [Pseudonocardia sp.]